jgi:hypothetical protein
VGVLGIAAVVVAAALAASAYGALFFLFQPTTASTGETATVRLGGTPASFMLEQRQRPFQRAIRLYLAPSGVASQVRSRFDARLHFIGSLVPDRNGHGVLPFRVPPLDSGAYVVASWCPACARHSLGRTFDVQTVPEVSRYRRLMGLRIRMPSATETCPVSGEGRYGNGLLSTMLPEDGILRTREDPDGLFQKLGWLPHRPFPDTLTVRGERLDSPGRMRVLGVNWGYSIVDGQRQRGSWASAVKFPSEGCWRLSGRVEDVTLSYVVQVVAGW